MRSAWSACQVQAAAVHVSSCLPAFRSCPCSFRRLLPGPPAAASVGTPHAPCRPGRTLASWRPTTLPKGKHPPPCSGFCFSLGPLGLRGLRALCPAFPSSLDSVLQPLQPSLGPLCALSSPQGLGGSCLPSSQLTLLPRECFLLPPGRTGSWHPVVCSGGSGNLSFKPLSHVVVAHYEAA